MKIEKGDLIMEVMSETSSLIVITSTYGNRGKGYMIDSMFNEESQEYGEIEEFKEEPFYVLDDGTDKEDELNLRVYLDEVILIEKGHIQSHKRTKGEKQ